MIRRHCVAYDIGHLLGLSDNALRQAVAHSASKDVPTAELRRRLVELRNKGFDVVPPCNVVDERGYCQGHEVEA